jgi:hypothetical protein
MAPRIQGNRMSNCLLSKAFGVEIDRDSLLQPAKPERPTPLRPPSIVGATRDKADAARRKKRDFLPCSGWLQTDNKDQKEYGYQERFRVHIGVRQDPTYAGD